MTDTEQIHVKLGVEEEQDINEPTLKKSADQSLYHINRGKDIKSEELDMEPATTPQNLSNEGVEIAKLGDGEASESDQARIERMGRERPTKFKSFAAELAFCYSVIASQFMSVRAVAATLSKGTKTN